MSKHNFFSLLISVLPMIWVVLHQNSWAQYNETLYGNSQDITSWHLMNQSVCSVPVNLYKLHRQELISHLISSFHFTQHNSNACTYIQNIIVKSKSLKIQSVIYLLYKDICYTRIPIAYIIDMYSYHNPDA